MKMARGCLVFIFVGLVCGGIVGQKPLVEMDFDTTMSCDDIQGLIEHFAEEFNSRGTPNALLIIKPDANNPSLAVRVAAEARHAVRVYRFGGPTPPRIKYAPTDDQKTSAGLFIDDSKEIWAKDQPIFNKLERPFFYNSDFSEACTTIDIEEFSRFLEANPLLHAKIYVVDDKPARRRRTALRWLRQITRRHSVARNRITIRFRREDHSSGWSTPYSSFSITP